MSRPQLSLPKKTINNGDGTVARTSISPLNSTDIVDVTCVPSALIIPVAVPSTPNLMSVGLSVDQRRLELIAKKVLGRFHPAGKSWFFTYAKRLMRLTDESLNGARNTLAKIYRYK